MRMLARVTASLSDDRAGDEGNAAGMPTNVGLEEDGGATAAELVARAVEERHLLQGRAIETHGRGAREGSRSRVAIRP